MTKTLIGTPDPEPEPTLHTWGTSGTWTTGTCTSTLNVTWQESTA